MQKTQKEIIIIVGPNGSGKSTLASQLVLPDPFINADMYAKSQFLHIACEQEKAQRASFAVAQKIKECLKKNNSFSFESVFALDKIPEFLLAAKKNGYLITVHFVALDTVSINIDRVALRTSQGGHNIPTDLIISRHKKVLALLPNLINFADKAILYDNTSKQSTPFLLKENNQIKILNDIPHWAIETIAKI